MKTETQHIILAILGIALVLCIWKEEMTYSGYIITALATFLSTKTLTEKQSEALEDTIEVYDTDDGEADDRQ